MIEGAGGADVSLTLFYYYSGVTLYQDGKHICYS